MSLPSPRWRPIQTAIVVLALMAVTAPLPAQFPNLLGGGQLKDGAPSATLKIDASLVAERLEAGQVATLVIKATIPEGFHLYSMDPGYAGRTKISLDKTPGLEPLGDFHPDRAPKKAHHPVLDQTVEEFYDQVVWTRPLRILDPAKATVQGSFLGTYCSSGTGALCKRADVNFETKLAEGTPPKSAVGVSASAGDESASSASGTGSTATTATDTANLPYYLALAFLGGLILNFMPCVLPVVAIKVMGFVQHAGQRRGHIFALNAFYAIGVISVFLALATLAALPHLFTSASTMLGFDLLGAMGLSSGTLTWGGLFQSPIFTAGMVILVFVMGLSLLGVYEIPIPGMVGAAAGSARHEGLAGAFMMGIFTTLLATPCTGPFLTSTLGWSLQQPVTVTYSIWAMMGFGMASPYLVFGLVPGAVKLLPKPGNWMIYFKQFAGFVLMATVLWLVRSLNTEYLLPLLFALLGIALACWLFGIVQYSTTRGKRAIVSVAALSLAVAAMIFGYDMTLKSEHELAWQPFSSARVNKLIAQDKTVLVDFTADWCASCKVNEAFALNTEETKTLVEEHGVATLLADVDELPDSDQWLDRFNAIGIPLTVIFPAGNADEPIVLTGVYSQATLLESLQKAVTASTAARIPSSSTASATPAAVTR